VQELERWTLLVRESGSSTRGVAERFLAHAGFHPVNRWELDSNEAIKRSVTAGLGIGFVSKLVVADEVERRELASESNAPIRCAARSTSCSPTANRHTRNLPSSTASVNAAR
jgi:DNA-binding transcriptional LysR family regulator